MGNRANIVVVEHHDWQLYYSHWAAAGSSTRSSAAGPRAAVRAVTAALRQVGVGRPDVGRRRCADRPDRRRLLFFR